MAHKMALAGNPNCGKTTLFNVLTGSNQYVGNWPGVTVQKKVGKTKVGHSEIVDLPGIYSLSPYTMEEIVTRDYIIDENPEVIINIIDGTNLERNLYLTVQLMELGRPMVIAVNMMDDVEQKGWKLDCNKLAVELGIPVVPITARRGYNVDQVLKKAEKLAHGKEYCIPKIVYDTKTQNALNDILFIISEKHYDKAIPLQFFAGKLLEGDEQAAKKLDLSKNQMARIEEIIVAYEGTAEYGDRETMLADARYKYIEQVAKKSLNKGKDANKLTVSDKIDKIVTNRFLAIPIFLLMMLGMFLLTFGPIGTVLSDWVDYLFQGLLAPGVKLLLDNASAPDWAYGLFLDAIIGGVSGILVFLPQITILFLCLSLLEDSGYMARAAFIMDRLLRKLGLSGKSFIPMLMGFGCTTPAVMAARALDNEKDRKLTMMLTPFMSCGARLPIYALFAELFFEKNQGLIVFTMYILGIVVAIITGVVLKNTLFKGNVAPFVMELPQYRLPLLKSILLHVWEKVKGFIIKAGTIIFAMSILVWVFQNFNTSFQMVTDADQSMLGQFGAWIAPIFIPLGFGTWQASVALLTGLIAKESVVSTITVLFAGGSQAALSSALAGAFTPLSAFAFMAFSLLYMPCISAFVTIRKEMGSMKWALGTAVMQTGIAYFVGLLIYQIGSLFIH
ncbi:ferrous iron transport protein B [Paludicola sp. MB14-C6]|uniref:ferrous iron transport protein B n=1 Tax=Paludihabitans sp. MB14-C6 TaxID=3070656 RepID=UPI0027DADF48|nr:ferrous iron transport protein B [Paludicola sp. MB14-C6]WMJ23820.1 ferrous iron transport protein B [Paludicola sp. MB14-C6]